MQNDRLKIKNAALGILPGLLATHLRQFCFDGFFATEKKEGKRGPQR